MRGYGTSSTHASRFSTPHAGLCRHRLRSRPGGRAQSRCRQPGASTCTAIAGRVRDDHVAVAVEDLAPRRGHVDRAHAVLRRRRDVLVGVQHLQRPQPEEQDAQQHRRDHAERRRPERERHRVGRGLGSRRRSLQIHRRACGRVGRAAAGAAAGSGRAGSSAGSRARSGARPGSRARSRRRAAPARRRGRPATSSAPGDHPGQRPRRRRLEHARARLAAAGEGRDDPGAGEIGERGHAEVAVEDGVEQEPAGEPATAASLEPAPEGERHHEDRHQVGAAAEGRRTAASPPPARP